MSKSTKKICQTSDCGQKVYAKGLCKNCYARQRRSRKIFSSRICAGKLCGLSFIPDKKSTLFCSYACRVRHRHPSKAAKILLGLCTRNDRGYYCMANALDGDSLCIKHRMAQSVKDENARIRHQQTKAYRTIAGSVAWHLYQILGTASVDKNHLHSYFGMPFYDEWNPRKGGSIRVGAGWILDNIGPRPEGKWELHIVDRSLGFVPGNLQWVPKEKHKAEELVAKLLLQIQSLKQENQILRHDIAAQKELEVCYG